MSTALDLALEIAQSRLPQGEAAQNLRTPSLHFDQRAVEHNIDRMLIRVKDPARWQPHIKTHKCAEIIELCVLRGVTRFKCATLNELGCIAKVAKNLDTCVEVCCAYPFYDKQWTDALRMTKHFTKLSVSWLVDSPAHYQHIRSSQTPLKLALDVDTGMGRSGTSPKAWIRFLQEQAAQLRSEHHDIAQLHGYEGHLGWNQQEQAFLGYQSLLEMHHLCATQGFSPALLTSGSHSYAHALNHDGLNHLKTLSRVSPGTIVLNDLHSNAAHEDLDLQFGALVASRVISVSERRITLDAGSKALAPDVQDDIARIVGHPAWRSKFQHEEHLVMHSEQGNQPFAPGDIVWLIPAHVCTTVNLHAQATLRKTQDETRPVKIASGHPWAQARL